MFFCIVETTEEVKVRNLMVYGHFAERKYRQGFFVPLIRLHGKWLREAGFEIGDNIRITFTENGIIISPGTNEKEL